METFLKFLSKICVSPTVHVSWPNLAKIGRCEVAEKSNRVAYKKTQLSGTLFSPPFRPHLADRALNFMNFFGAYVPTLVRIGCGLPDLFRKESKKVKTI